MKTKILSSTIMCLAVLCSNKTQAQCSVTISGDSCVNKTLTANFTGTGTDRLNSLVWKYNGNLAYSTSANGYDPQYLIGASGGAMDGPNPIVVDDSDNVFVAVGSASKVEKHRFDGTITVIANLSFMPQDLYIIKDTLYVTGSNAAGTVRAAEKWAPGATSGVRIAGNTTSISLSNPKGIFVDKSGNVYISDLGNNRVIKIPPGGTTFTSVAGNHGAGNGANQLNGNLGIQVDKNGNVFVVDAGNARIQKWAAGAGSGTTVAGGHGNGGANNQLSGATYLVLKNNDMFIAESTGDRVTQWTQGAASGTTIAGGFDIIGGDSSIHLYTPWGVALDRNGTVFVSDKRTATTGWVKKFLRWNKVFTSYLPNDAGTYAVTATSTGGCIASKSIIVNIAPSAIDSITGPGKVDIGATNLVYTAHSNQHGGTVTYNWAVPADATIVSGQGTSSITVTWGSNPGTVKVNAKNNCGQTPAITKKVKLRTSFAEAASADNTIIADSKLMAWPNPAKDKLQIQTKGITLITLANQYGKVLLTQNINGRGEINVSHLPAGMYYVTDNTTRQTQKVMIIK